MSKILDFRIRENYPEPGEKHYILTDEDIKEYRNLMSNKVISPEEFEKCIDVAFTFLAQNKVGDLFVDLDQRKEERDSEEHKNKFISYDELKNMKLGDLINLMNDNKEDFKPCDICEYNPDGVKEETLKELL